MCSIPYLLYMYVIILHEHFRLLKLFNLSDFKLMLLGKACKQSTRRVTAKHTVFLNIHARYVVENRWMLILNFDLQHEEFRNAVIDSEADKCPIENSWWSKMAMFL